MEAPLLGFFEAFSLKCTQLKQAVASGDDDLVRLLDKELEPMIADILSFRAQTREAAHMQLQFLNGLIRDEADDRSSVTRRSAAMSMLIDRYFGPSGDEGEAFQRAFPHLKNNQSAFEPADQPLLNEAILDSLPDRVAVITRDYRYLFANQANARFLNRTALSLVGCHVSDLVGVKSFEALAKPAFDKCFRGETVDYVHVGCRASKAFSTRCRMTPLRGVNQDIIGAVVVLQSVNEAALLERS